MTEQVPPTQRQQPKAVSPSVQERHRLKVLRVLNARKFHRVLKVLLDLRVIHLLFRLLAVDLWVAVVVVVPVLLRFHLRVRCLLPVDDRHWPDLVLSSYCSLIRSWG